MRRAMLALFIVSLVVTNAWPKFKEDEQHYLDEQFKAIQDQVQALTTQLQTLNAQLLELRKNQAQFQAIIDRQQRSLQDLDQLVISMRLGNEESSSNLKAAINQLRTDTQAAFNKLGAVGAAAPAAATEATMAKPQAPAAQVVVQGSIISDVKDDSVTIDLGSRQGVHELARLAVFKDTDPNTQVGILEVTQVIDGGNSRARILQVNPGVQLGFGDVVRLQ